MELPGDRTCENVLKPQLEEIRKYWFNKIRLIKIIILIILANIYWEFIVYWTLNNFCIKPQEIYVLIITIFFRWIMRNPEALVNFSIINKIINDGPIIVC